MCLGQPCLVRGSDLDGDMSRISSRATSKGPPCISHLPFLVRLIRPLTYHFDGHESLRPWQCGLSPTVVRSRFLRVQLDECLTAL
jgi:hypothetical protein